MTLGDCSRVRVRRGVNERLKAAAAATLQILYVYRVAMLEIVSIDASIRQLHILHSTVKFVAPYALSESPRLHELSFVGTFVDAIIPLAFAGAQLELLRANGSTLRASGNAFAGARVAHLELQSTNVIAAGGLFEVSARVHAEDSVSFFCSAINAKHKTTKSIFIFLVSSRHTRPREQQRNLPSQQFAQLLVYSRRWPRDPSKQRL